MIYIPPCMSREKTATDGTRKRIPSPLLFCMLPACCVTMYPQGGLAGDRREASRMVVFQHSCGQAETDSMQYKTWPFQCPI